MIGEVIGYVLGILIICALWICALHIFVNAIRDIYGDIKPKRKSRAMTDDDLFHCTIGQLISHNISRKGK